MTKVLIALVALALSSRFAQAQVLQDFETGQGDWYANNGSWEIGTPTAGPPSCHQGTGCAGTVLGGNYPKNGSQLISPPVQLAQGTVQNPVLLRFWHWFSWAWTPGQSGALADRGVVQVSVYDHSLSAWSDWTNVGSVFTGSSGAWSLNLVDLTAFSGRLVRIAFYHQGFVSASTSAGWYVDDIEIAGVPLPPADFTALQNFEAGQGNWFADNGVWEVGLPTAGPAGCHQGTRCAGTILDGNYPKTNSRLISPPVQLAQGTVQNPVMLRFWHWFSWAWTPGQSGALADRGAVQVSAYDPALATWSTWTSVGSVFTGSSGVWTLTLVDLTAFSGRLVRIAFYQQGTISSSTSTGWYLDDIELDAGAQGTPPSISDITNQTINQGASTPAVAFTVGDAETPASALTVSGASSNATLVPQSGIVFGGSGAARTITVTPAPGQSGTATMTVAVTDGDGLTASDVFLLTVLSTADSDGDGLPDGWETQFGLNPSSAAGNDGAGGDPDGDGETNLEEYQRGKHPRGFFKRYLAEGAINAFFDVRLALLNVGTVPARVLLRFLQPGGVTLPLFELLPNRRRRTLTRADLSGLVSPDFSTVVESDQPIVVDRTMSWDAGAYGSHAESSVASPATTWYLAEGSTSGDFALFYLLQNANPTGTTATVRYLRPFGQPPIERTYALPPNSRTTIPVDTQGPELASTDVSAVVTAPQPIIVERAMYMTRSGLAFAAGHGSAGVTAPATSWFLAEGATGPFFDLFILLANPSDQVAQVTVDYLLLDGTTLAKSYSVPANGRFTVWVDDEQIPAGSGVKPLDNVAASIAVTSTNGVPIIVERTMWWPSPALTSTFWTEAHNSPGATATAARWALAEGEVGGPQGAETYVLIANVSAFAGNARVTLAFEDGTTVERTFALQPRSRTNVSVSVEFPAAASRRFSTFVESQGATPAQIVVERAMYTSPGGVTWSAGTNALATPLP